MEWENLPFLWIDHVTEDELFCSRFLTQYRKKFPVISIFPAGQSPPWARNKERTSLNSARRKPQRRVPITAPPPVETSTSTTFSSGLDTTTVMTMTTTSSSSSSPISTFSYTFLPKMTRSTTEKTILGCGAVARRGIGWPLTPAGSVSVKTCAKGTKATWLCQSSGVWSPSGPDLSNCQGKKWKLRPAKELENLVGSGTIHLYGGDIVPLLDLVASLTDQFRSTRSETNARYCIPVNTFTLYNVLHFCICAKMCALKAMKKARNHFYCNNIAISVKNFAWRLADRKSMEKWWS